ncbi:MAG: selenocysteine-specific translation elongation factor [Armatimonas sp.]
MSRYTEAFMRHVIVGTAGHVDHGKTTLIQALTGTNTDRLAEEQARGMTIDLGFAHLALGDSISAGIVDVPGHEKFVKNMLAGAGGVDIALLVVAADEGPMPQTREHLDILSVLGVNSGVIALTRSDLAEPELQELVALETRSALENTPLAKAPIIPVSAVTGAGLAELKAALAEAAESAPLRDDHAPLRLPVDRVFSLPGVGTVVTGTLTTGTLRVGDAVMLEPQALTSKARTLQNHSHKIELAHPGMRVAVNLPGVEVEAIERGAVLCAPHSLSATTLIDVRLSLLSTARRPLEHRERVRVHLGTGETLARLYLLERDALAPGDTDVPAQLLFEEPVAPARGERLVLRTYSPQRAVGGGVVLDPLPSRRHRRRDPAALALYTARSTGQEEGALYATLASRHGDFPLSELEKTVASPAPALEALIGQRRAFVLSDGRYLSDTAAQRLKDTARRTLEAFHRQNPYKKAMPESGLRAPLTKAAMVKDFNALVAFLIAEGICVKEDTGLRLPEWELTVPPGWQKAAGEIEAVFKAAGYQPPGPRDFIYPKDIVLPAIFIILTESGALVKLTDDLYLHRETYNKALDTVRQLATTPEGISVASLRDATDSSRKIILPLLEHLDGIRITRRIDDNKRVLV